MVVRKIGVNVFDAALDRLRSLYRDGHRVVYSFSAGKDSGICVELGLIAAAEYNALPIDVVMRDEEIMFPGTFEYAERMADRPGVRFHWMYANQPILNIFNREDPYFWVFDPLLDPDEWVRKPPAFAKKHPKMDITSMVTSDNFPPPEGKELFDVLGLRAAESPGRRMGMHSAGGWLTKEVKGAGFRKARPVYDWKDEDVWLAIHRYGWDYNHAYDALHRLGVNKMRLRIAPPTLTLAGLPILKAAAQAWPRWFDRVAKRLPGVRAAAAYGKVACTAYRFTGETWEHCFQRTCIDEAPAWIAERAAHVRDVYLSAHSRHSTAPFPEVVGCKQCTDGSGSWKQLTMGMYGGDPFCLKQGRITLPLVEPEFFRAGAGEWGGAPQW